MKKLTTISACLIGFCFIFLSGCGTGLSELPKNAAVYGNGGSSVIAGDYMYFANQHIAYSSITEGFNNEGAVTDEAIVRVKLENGKPISDEDGKVITETVVKKVGGFENSQIAIVSGNLYFTSPNIHKTVSGANAFGRVSLFKASTSGNGIKEYYTSNNENVKLEFYEYDGKSYLLLLDGKELIKFDLTSGASRTLLSNNATQFVVDKTIPSKYIYITSPESDKPSIGEDDTKKNSIISRIDITTGQKLEYAEQVGVDYTLVGLSANVLYYTRTESSSLFYYSNDFSNGMNSELEQISASSVTDIDFLGLTITDAKCPFVYIFEGNMYLKDLADPIQNAEKVIDSTAISGSPTEILMTKGDYIYYASTTGFYRISYKDRVVQEIATFSDSANFKTSGVGINGNLFCYYAYSAGNTTNAYYNFAIDLNLLGSDNNSPVCYSALESADVFVEENTEE